MTTSKLMNLVGFSNLTFEEACMSVGIQTTGTRGLSGSTFLHGPKSLQNQYYTGSKLDLRRIDPNLYIKSANLLTTNEASLICT